MAAIIKFSFAYDPAEDRLALDTEDDAGVAARLWLTQRLCRGVVAALIPVLQNSVAGHLPPDAQATLQSWEQAAALEGFGQAPPVKADTGSGAGLANAVHIRPRDDGLSLTVDFATGESRFIPMSFAALRQALSEMHRLFVVAGWPRDIWPEWIANPGTHAAGGMAN